MKILQLTVASFILCCISPFIHAEERYNLQYCDRPGFTCITVKRGQAWESLWPDTYQRQIVMRLNRMNVPLRRGMRVAVPDNLASIDLLDISPFPLVIIPPKRKMIVVNPNILAWGAYDPYGNLVLWGPMSGGRDYCADIQDECRTVSGNFTVYRKQGEECKSKEFPVDKGGAPMPYCMFFYAGYALHASETVPGYNASHGCVRIFLEDAEWLNQNFVDLPDKGHKPTQVIVNPYDDAGDSEVSEVSTS